MDGAVGDADVDCDSKLCGENMANIRLRITKAKTFNERRILGFSDGAPKSRAKAGVSSVL